jgi:hypothetical protein
MGTMKSDHNNINCDHINRLLLYLQLSLLKLLFDIVGAA